MHTAPPQLELAGDVLLDHYHVASLTLCFARGTGLGREGCWALALGAATLASCMGPGARLAIQRGGVEPPAVRVRLFGRFAPGTQETVALTLARLRDLGFSTPWSYEALLELHSGPASSGAVQGLATRG